MNQHRRILSWGLLLILSLIWGSSFILIKRGLDAFNPFDLGALRMLIAGICLLPFAVKYYTKVATKSWKYILLVGLIGNGIPAFLFPYAETVISSASAGILNTLTPIFVLIIGISFFNFPFSARKLIGILLGLLGSILLIVLGQGKVNITEHALYSLLIIVACVGYAVSSNVIKKHLNDTNPIAISTFSILSMAIPYCFYLGYNSLHQDLMAHPLAWLSLGYISLLSVFGTVAALMLFYRLLQLTDPLFTSSVTYLIPIVAIAWGLLDGEFISPLQLIGMGVIFMGVYLVNR